MRPVNKGVAPEKEYKHYQDAEPDLEARLGPYCSFCEMGKGRKKETKQKNYLIY